MVAWCPTSPAAYGLLHDGSLALARVEANGIRIDTDYIQQAIADTGGTIDRISERLKGEPEWAAWTRRYGTNSDLGKLQQLGVVLYEDMGYPNGRRTAGGKQWVTDESELEKIPSAFVFNYLRLRKWQKARGTYLQGILGHTQDGYLHPFFNLHKVETFRGSSDAPNFQNIPIRDPEMGALIRQAFIPRDGHVIVEIDYTAIEVRVAACYHRDPRMLQAIIDGYDMHRDAAARLFFLAPDDVPKQLRQGAKGAFVFAEFYGDYFKQVSPKIWAELDTLDKQGVSINGHSVKEHLAAHGITSLGACAHRADSQPGTFEHHVKKVEHWLWKEQFTQYDKWRRDWFAAYQSQGWFRTLTGFSFAGIFTRNEVINWPVQGSAFHCLLWALIRLQRWLDQNKKRSLLIGQIHDSIVADVHLSELEEFLAIAQEIMVCQLPAAWPWIITPLAVEAEVAPEGKSWHHKRPLAIAG